VIFFRQSDRVAICGDVIRKLAELNPSLILPGHGPAVADIAAFERFVAALLA